MTPLNFFTRTAGRIVLWCLLAIAFSHVTDALVAINYFDDRLVDKPDWRGMLTPRQELEWGMRHYWWNTMCVLLIITAVARLCVVTWVDMLRCWPRLKNAA